MRPESGRAGGGLRLQVVLQAHAVDQAQLLFQPVGVVFFRVLELRQEDVAAHVVAHALAQVHARLQGGPHFVFGVEVLAQHLGHRGSGREFAGAHVGQAPQEQDAAQQRVGVLGLFLHLVVQALVELHEALVFVDPRMDEILIARCQFAAQQILEVVDDLWVALHGVLFSLFLSGREYRAVA